MNCNSQFQGYKRCTKCDKTFRNYIEENRCPFCKETEYVKDLFKKENNEDSQS